jgi:peptidoglycan/LPS O-acetylase OafA/YrhL
MRTLVLVCNIVSLAFTLLVLATDGPATKASYIGFTFLLFLIPLFTLLALARPRTFPAKTTTILRLAATCNLVLLAFVCWALVDQHPHPNEPGFVPYAALMILTPILSAVVLLRHRPTELPQS